jgi:hypothetical protein
MAAIIKMVTLSSRIELPVSLEVFSYLFYEFSNFVRVANASSEMRVIETYARI